MKVPTPRKLPSGSWFVQLRLGGESISITAATEKECRNQAALIKAEHVAGRRRRARSELTLREVCQQYIARKERAGASPATIRGYANIVNNRFQMLMDQPVSRSSPWQKAYDVDSAGHSAKTMANAWGFIRTACRKECGLELPEITTKAQDRIEHTFLDPEQIKLFVAATKGDKYQIPLLLCLSSFRASEVQGLTWDSVDLKAGRMHVCRTVVLDKDQKYVEKARTKTEGSDRWVPIFIPELRAALEAVQDKTGSVVSCRPNTVYRRANAICADLGLPLVGQHGLRHSFASLCYSLEVPLRITMRIGGWENERVVSEIYTHLDRMHVDRQITKLEQFFAGS